MVKNKLVDFLRLYNVVDIKLIPSLDFDSLIINLYYYPKPKEYPDMTVLTDYLCQYSQAIFSD